MNGSKSILIASPEIPHPVFKGNQCRIDGTIRAIQRLGYVVHLAVLNTNQPNRKSIDIERELAKVYQSLASVTVRQHPRLKRRRREYTMHLALSRVEKFVGKADDISNRETCPSNFRRAVERRIQDVEPDVIYVNYLRLSRVIPSWYKGRIVVDTHDIQSNLIKATAFCSKSKRKKNLGQLRHSEFRTMRTFDALIAINPNEAQEITHELQGKTNVITIPMFVDLPALAQFERAQVYDALFVGSASPLNVDAALQFIANCLPPIKHAFPNFRLGLAGDVCSCSALQNIKESALVRLGRVADLSEVYAKSKVIICPLRGGAGMKVKVIEAMAHGKAIVTTPVGADGIDLEHGISAFIQEDWKEFSNRVIELLQDDKKRQWMGALARRTADLRYSQNALLAPLARAIEGCDVLRLDESAEYLAEVKPLAVNGSALARLARKRRTRALIFSMDARALMEYAVHFGKELRKLGIYSEFVKVEASHFNYFHKEGFIVHSVKGHLTTEDRERAERHIRESQINTNSLDNIIYDGIDFSEEIRVHKEMFSAHFEGKKQYQSIRYAIMLLQALSRMLGRVRPDLLIGWNGNGPHMIYLMKVLGKKFDIPVLHMERGLLPDTYVLDPQGVNYKSYLAGSFLPICHEEEIDSATRYVSWFQENFKSIVPQQERIDDPNDLARRLGLQSNERYIFFAEQIEGDSNIVINSPRYKLMVQAIQDIQLAAAKYGLRIVVRPHPEEDASCEAPHHEHVIVNRDIHLHSLLKHSVCNIVINSTVGLESLLFQRPTIVLGNSVYSGKGATFDARCAEDIAASIAEVLSGDQLAHQRHTRFLGFLYLLISRYLIFTTTEFLEGSNKRAITVSLAIAGVKGDETMGQGLTPLTPRAYLDGCYKNWQDALASFDGGVQPIVVDLLGSGTYRYYTGRHKPQVTVENFLREIPQIVDRMNITVITTNVLPDESDRRSRIVFKNFARPMHTQADLLKHIVSANGDACGGESGCAKQIIVLMPQSSKLVSAWAETVDKVSDLHAIKPVRLDEYFVPY